MPSQLTGINLGSLMETNKDICCFHQPKEVKECPQG